MEKRKPTDHQKDENTRQSKRQRTKPCKLNKLPPENKMVKEEKADEKPKEKYTLFYKGTSPFSQHYPVKFTVGDVTYNCAEQYMMHQKALLFHDDKHAVLIMKAVCPKAMKKLGRKVQNFDKGIWNNKSKDIVKKGNFEKFNQNRNLKEILLKTEGTVLAEASPRDRLWGIGLGASNPKAHFKQNWRGKNQLGYILTDVRHELMEREKVKEELETL